jgi:hypothetical protein
MSAPDPVGAVRRFLAREQWLPKHVVAAIEAVVARMDAAEASLESYRQRTARAEAECERLLLDLAHTEALLLDLQRDVERDFPPEPAYLAWPAERERLIAERNAANKLVNLAGGFHQRSEREIEIEEELTQAAGWWVTAAKDLLALVDAGRNRVFTEREARETAEARATRFEAALREQREIHSRDLGRPCACIACAALAEAAPADTPKEPRCPACGGRLAKVVQSESSMLNEHQWRSQIAGEYVCEGCPQPNGRGQDPANSYWWAKEQAEAAPADARKAPDFKETFAVEPPAEEER